MAFENNLLPFKLVLYANYGELVLKKKNRKYFLATLKQNIIQLLIKNKIHNKVDFSYDHCQINDVRFSQIAKLKELFQVLPGIVNFFFAYEIERQTDLACQVIYALAKNFKNFKVEVFRKDKSFIYRSSQYKKLLGLKLIREFNLRGELENPQILINLLVNHSKFLIFSQKYLGVNGLPVYSSGRILCLLSGGIDSPVASAMLMQRGFNVDFLTFVTATEKRQEVLDKVLQLTKAITKNNSLATGKLYVCDFLKLQQEIAHVSNQAYRLIIMRRCFFRIAELLCLKHNYDAICTGEALGQVASQTIQAIKAIQNATPNLLVLRPLLGMHKQAIINQAEKLKTYQISILPFEDSCEMFAPKNPVIKPQIKTVNKLEKELEFLDPLITITTANINCYE